VNTNPPKFSWQTWFDKSYQDSTEAFLKDSIPLKPTFVRIRNQVDFSFFRKIYVKDSHIGKDDQFFRYTNYFVDGGNYPGDSILEKNIKKLKTIQEKLKQKGKTLVYVIAADKLWYYSELLPEGVLNKKSTRFYDTYLKYLKKYDCDYIDFNQAFLQMKDTVQGALFAKGGYHWTKYGAFIAMDSIVKHIEASNQYSVEDIKQLNYNINNTISAGDEDMYDACNLQFGTSKSSSFWHPQITFSNKKSKSVAIITGDSFCDAICWNNFFYPFFDTNSTYWYYNREIFAQDNTTIENKNGIIEQKLIEKSDIYIILFSAGNLENFEYNFLDNFKE
jgi:hypothetical protein